MTATGPLRLSLPSGGDTPILEFLQTVHASWLQEVRGILDAALSAEAGVWMRWGANRHLQTNFARWLDREREAIASARHLLTGAQSANLWALGELLDLLREHLDHAVGICQRAEEFSIVTRKLLRALTLWCDGVEDAMGQVRWSELPPTTQRLFGTLSEDVSVHGS